MRIEKRVLRNNAVQKGKQSWQKRQIWLTITILTTLGMKDEMSFRLNVLSRLPEMKLQIPYLTHMIMQGTEKLITDSRNSE